MLGFSRFITMKRFSRILVLVAFAVRARAEDFTGKVVAITDGDTIKVMQRSG